MDLSKRTSSRRKTKTPCGAQPTMNTTRYPMMRAHVGDGFRINRNGFAGYVVGPSRSPHQPLALIPEKAFAGEIAAARGGRQVWPQKKCTNYPVLTGNDRAFKLVPVVVADILTDGSVDPMDSEQLIERLRAHGVTERVVTITSADSIVKVGPCGAAGSYSLYLTRKTTRGHVAEPPSVYGSLDYLARYAASRLGHGVPRIYAVTARYVPRRSAK